MDETSSEWTLEYTDQEGYWTMDGHLSNNLVDAEVLESLHYSWPDQRMPQHHPDLDANLQALEGDRYCAVDDTGMLSVSEEMSGHADITAGPSTDGSDEVYYSPYTVPDKNTILSDHYFYSGHSVEHRPVTTAPGYPVQSDTHQSSTSRHEVPLDGVLPKSAGNEPWVPPGIEVQGPFGNPKFYERPLAAEYYSHEAIAAGDSQERNTLFPGESINMPGTEDIVLPDGPQYHAEFHEQEYPVHPAEQDQHAPSLNNRYDVAGYHPNSDYGLRVQEWPSIGNSPIPYRTQPAAPVGFVGLSDYATDQNVPSPSFTTMDNENRIGYSPEPFTSFGQQASGYVGSWPEQVRMTDPAAVAAQPSGFDLRVQMATPVLQREPEGRRRKKSHRYHSDTPPKHILPRKERSRPAGALSGRQLRDAGPFQTLDHEMQPMIHRRTRNLSPGGREHAKKMRKKGVCDECKRKKSKCTHRLEEDLSSLALSRSSSTPTWQTPSTPGSAS